VWRFIELDRRYDHQRGVHRCRASRRLAHLYRRPARRREVQRPLDERRRRIGRHGHGVSGSSFTVSTPTGGKVTVKESSSTVYDEGTTKSTASAVTKGKTVLVIGKVDSTTITASQVIVGPSINLKTASANTIAFKQPNSSESNTTGTIPSSYKEGTGTIVSGTTATKATDASLSSYAGGVVDRVVRLSNGDYEVHDIGTNWPHHVFETSNFKVTGAND
jgi:hypothetical protein